MVLQKATKERGIKSETLFLFLNNENKLINHFYFFFKNYFISLIILKETNLTIFSKSCSSCLIKTNSSAL